MKKPDLNVYLDYLWSENIKSEAEMSESQRLGFIILMILEDVDYYQTQAFELLSCDRRVLISLLRFLFDSSNYEVGNNIHVSVRECLLSGEWPQIKDMFERKHEEMMSDSERAEIRKQKSIDTYLDNKTRM